jgi:hypothetical protein
MKLSPKVIVPLLASPIIAMGAGALETKTGLSTGPLSAAGKDMLSMTCSLWGQSINVPQEEIVSKCKLSEPNRFLRFFQGK